MSDRDLGTELPSNGWQKRVVPRRTASRQCVLLGFSYRCPDVHPFPQHATGTGATACCGVWQKTSDIHPLVLCFPSNSDDWICQSRGPPQKRLFSFGFPCHQPQKRVPQNQMRTSSLRLRRSRGIGGPGGAPPLLAKPKSIGLQICQNRVATNQPLKGKNSRQRGVRGPG